MRALIVWVLAAAFLAGISAKSNAEDRVALVIGNSSYSWGYLENPANDAELVAETLEGLGFTVIKRVDVDKAGLERAIRDYAVALRDAPADSVGLVWYAGHGVQDAGENYLIPLGAQVEDVVDLPFEAVPASELIDAVKRVDGALSPGEKRVRFFIFDACRNNPLPASIFRDGGTGLGRMDAPAGTYIAYSTSPNQVAADGKGDNSPYATAFADVIATPGVTVDDAFQRIRTKVTTTTEGRQLPWSSSSLIGEAFCFAGCANTGVRSEEQITWDFVARLGTSGAFQAYLDQYPDGAFAADARTRLAAANASTAAGADANLDAVGPIWAKFTDEEWSTVDYRVLLNVALDSTDFAAIREAADAGDVDAATLAAWAYGEGLGGVTQSDADAVRFYELACDAGALRACVGWANEYFDGKGGVTRDLAKVIELLRRACDGGNQVGCSNLAVRYVAGEGVDKDVARGIAMYEAACAQNYVGACLNLGYQLRDGVNVTRDIDRAVALFRDGCDARHGDSCAALGYAHEQGDGVEADAARALELYVRGCDARSGGGCNNAGIHYAKGTGAAQDWGQAATYYRRACDLGLMSGCSNLAYRYENGEGVETDPARAIELLGQACDGAIASACANLGYRFEMGQGIEKDLTRARGLYEKACDLGEMQGCSNLGVFYGDGLGVPQDYLKAESYYRVACDADLPQACNNLGVLYYNGRGVERSLETAVQLYGKACVGGYRNGCNNLTSGARELNNAGRGAETLALLKAACEARDWGSCLQGGWNGVTSNEYTMAEEIARFGADAAGSVGGPSESYVRSIQTNLAHALMLQNRIEEADALYLGNRGNQTTSGAWNTAVLGDFDALEAKGITHPHMAEVRAKLAESAE